MIVEVFSPRTCMSGRRLLIPLIDVGNVTHYLYATSAKSAPEITSIIFSSDSSFRFTHFDSQSDRDWGCLVISRIIDSTLKGIEPFVPRRVLHLVYLFRYRWNWTNIQHLACVEFGGTAGIRTRNVQVKSLLWLPVSPPTQILNYSSLFSVYRRLLCVGFEPHSFNQMVMTPTGHPHLLSACCGGLRKPKMYGCANLHTA